MEERNSLGGRIKYVGLENKFLFYFVAIRRFKAIALSGPRLHWPPPSVADSHYFDADPDPAFHIDADPDPDPTTHFFQIWTL